MKNILVAASGGAIDSTVFATALAAARPRQQNMRLLEGLADTRDAERHRRSIEAGRGAAARERGRCSVRGIDAPAGEDQRARGEIRGDVARHHQHLEPVRPVAQQQHGCRRPRHDLRRCLH